MALDRAVKLADKLGDGANVRSWEAARDDVRRTVLERGWSERATPTPVPSTPMSWTHPYLLPLVGFPARRRTSMWATIEAVRRELARMGWSTAGLRSAMGSSSAPTARRVPRTGGRRKGRRRAL
ncbi:MAG: hypothetical protein WKH64_07485 [Chloroflexia bacterium]